jgi:hypothetical protein
MVVTWIMRLSGLVAARTEILREKFAPLDVAIGAISFNSHSMHSLQPIF